MTDIVQLLLKAGDGGHGWVSFRREKYVPRGGPDGGQGGDGGDIVLRATSAHATLDQFAGVRQILAKNGKAGTKRKKNGAAAENTILEVPLGTVVWQVASRHIYDHRHQKYYLEKETEPIPPRPDHEEPLSNDSFNRHTFSKQEPGPEKVQLARLVEEGQEYVVCRGGKGGRGSHSFKSSSNTTPLEAEYGTWGQERLIVLELEMLADVGLVGLPNAGKSTFISKVTKARPKIANYPFTTLSPNLGVWSFDDTRERSSVVVADIPGLIEGASEGKGLGHDFLRHIRSCKVLLYFIYLTEEVVYEEDTSDQEKVQQLVEQYQLLKNELATYSDQLSAKPSAVVVNKVDIYPDSLVDEIELELPKEVELDESQQVPLFLSSATNQGMNTLEAVVQDLLDRVDPLETSEDSGEGNSKLDDE